MSEQRMTITDGRYSATVVIRVNVAGPINGRACRAAQIFFVSDEYGVSQIFRTPSSPGLHRLAGFFREWMRTHGVADIDETRLA